MAAGLERKWEMVVPGQKSQIERAWLVPSSHCPWFAVNEQECIQLRDTIAVRSFAFVARTLEMVVEQVYRRATGEASTITG